VAHMCLLFSDIEGSTRLLQRWGATYVAALEEHKQLLRDCWVGHAGDEVSTEGDSFFVVFENEADAVAAAVAAQLALTRHSWPEQLVIRVRMGVHAGDVTMIGGAYAGMTVHEAARIAASAHGGQLVVSDRVRIAAGDGTAGWLDLGDHQLKDLAGPLRLWQATHPELPVAFPPLRSQGSTPHNLPAPTTSFIGRVADIEAIGSLLDDDRIVTVLGPGGVGKTRLVQQAAASLLGRFPDGVWFIPLAPQPAGSDVDEVAAVVASVLTIDAAEVDTTRAVGDHIRDRRALFILDNCEHLLDGAAALAELLANASRDVRILATSRESLALAGERTWRIPMLGIEDSRRLLLDRGRSAAGTAVVATDDDVSELCRQLDGLPLAVELAAARLGSMSVREVLDRLDERFELLAGRRGGLPHHRAMQATIEWSYDLLELGDQVLLRRLGLFASDVGPEAIASVSNIIDETSTDVTAGLDRLVAASLATMTEHDTGKRFGLLETIRAFAVVALDQAGELERARDAHAAWLGRLVSDATAGFEAGEERAGVTAIRSVAAEIAPATQWASRRTPDVAVACVPPAWFWSYHGDMQLGRRVCAAALEHADTADADLRARALLAQAYVSTGVDMATAQGAVRNVTDLVRAHPALTIRRAEVAVARASRLPPLDPRLPAALAEAEARVAEVEQPYVHLRALLLGTQLNVAPNDSDRRRELAADLVTLCESGDGLALAYALEKRALSELDAGNVDEARALLERTIALARADGHHLLIVSATFVLSEMVAAQDSAAALAGFEEVLALQRAASNNAGASLTLNEIAWAHVVRGETAAAQARAREAVALMGPAHPAAWRAQTLHTFAVANRSHPDQAAPALVEVLELAAGFQDPTRSLLQATAFEELAGLAYRRSDEAAAAELLGRAVAAAASVGERNEAWGFPDERAELAAALGPDVLAPAREELDVEAYVRSLTNPR
jgi:predicted ATPase/class 3 adenylate cyclase